MVKRAQKLSENSSLFLFGPRGSGKSTLLREYYPPDQVDILWLDLLDPELEEKLSKEPGRLKAMVEDNKTVVIDEVQKVPKILDVVHSLIEEKKDLHFKLSGSSDRKLKRGGANLLAGRAIIYHLYPFSVLELKKSEFNCKFNLNQALSFGLLPKALELKNVDEKIRYLQTYCHTYLKEDILVEQLIRNIDPFREFLGVAAQMNGKIINYSKIATEVGVDNKTIQSYFQILEDTLIGFFLPPFHRSIRKRQRLSPKFYFIDMGIKRALNKTISLDLEPRSYAFGDAFEHLILLELVKLNSYYNKDYDFYYLRTKDGVEVDIIVTRPGKKDLLIEIKSKDQALERDTKTLKKIASDWDKDCEAQLWSLDEDDLTYNSVKCIHWRKGLDNLFKPSHLIDESFAK